MSRKRASSEPPCLAKASRTTQHFVTNKQVNYSWKEQMEDDFLFINFYTFGGTSIGCGTGIGCGQCGQEFIQCPFFDRLMKHLKATYDCEGFGFYTSQTKILTKVNELVIVARREHPHDLVGFYMITPATKDSGPNLHLIESFTKHLGYGQMMLSYIMQNMYIKEGPLVVSDLLYSAFPFWKAAKLRWRDRITFSDKLHRELIDTYCKLQDSD